MRIAVHGNHYSCIEHRRVIPNTGNPLSSDPTEALKVTTQVYALTLISEKRQAKKKLGLSGRQYRKHKKANQRGPS